MKKYLAIFVLTLITIYGCSGKAAEKQERSEKVKVTLFEVGKSEVSGFLTVSGTVKADKEALLSSKVMGVIKEIRVKEGDTVKKGELLVKIDDADLRTKAAEIEAVYKNSKINKERWEALYKEKSVSAKELEDVTLGYERAKANYDNAKVYLGYSNIKAPFSGMVTQKAADAGTMASPGQPILKVEDISRLFLEVEIPEELLGKIKVNDKVNYSIEQFKENVFEGRISEVVLSVDPRSRTFKVKIAVIKKDAKLGAYGKAYIKGGAAQNIIIPQKGIIEKGGLTAVYAAGDDGKVYFRLVKTGKKLKDDIEIISGLKQGEKIVVSGFEKLYDSAPYEAEK